MNIEFSCVICEKHFKDETDLNSHTLFEHGVQRGYCDNPNSVTHLDELSRLHTDLGFILKKIRRKYRNDFEEGLERSAFAIILRLEELGEKINVSSMPEQFDLREWRRKWDAGITIVYPDKTYENLARTTDFWIEIDKQAEIDVMEANNVES